MSDLKRPDGVSRYMWKQYLSDFSHGCQFWTSEDGTECELVCLPTDESYQRLLHEFSRLNIADKPVKKAFVERGHAGPEFFDGASGQTHGAIWRLTDDVTPFPVYVVDPYNRNTMFGGT